MSESSARTSDTARLYYDDATLARFSAIVTDIANEGRVVYLDRSAFYPTSGGQPHDLGWLAEVPVVDVVDEDERIAHHLAEPLGLPVGAMVVGQIDMGRRIDHMQQHTGQHLLSALLADRYGWPTVSVHFGDVTSTVDVAVDAAMDGSANDVSAEQLAEQLIKQLAEIEARVNTLALDNLDVTISYEDAATASGLRKASDREGVLRIVTIDGLDRSACGGTHVSRTAEIGAILLRRAEKTRGHVRIEFVCGHRAVARARADAELLTRTARPLSAAPQDVPALVEQLQQRVVELEREHKRLTLELAKHEASALWTEAPVDGNGIRRVRVAVAGAVKDAEPLAQQIIARGNCLMLVTNPAMGGVLLASAADVACDAGRELRAALQLVGGRGGGSPRLAQGAVPGDHDDHRRETLNAVARMLGF
ncbi:alanyl-tRNA editing protein [Gemmatimonas aurantiaca]|uniref:alanyl-tRNA editing protein n=1 Tax=Gemmatimonas aurantiaca TaxID=173480 RepID=UPI00301BA90E